jgi:hypothetical protein
MVTGQHGESSVHLATRSTASTAKSWLNTIVILAAPTWQAVLDKSREVVWIALLVSGLSAGSVGFAVGLAVAMREFPKIVQ